MSVTVVGPEKQEHPLGYWDVVTHAFSSLGKKAEWRVVRSNGKMSPIALIVRVNYIDQSNPAAPKHESCLAVAKITEDKVCVTDKIKGANANERARQAADQSAEKDCLAP
jgi:hypothetical protein